MRVLPHQTIRAPCLFQVNHHKGVIFLMYYGTLCVLAWPREPSPHSPSPHYCMRISEKQQSMNQAFRSAAAWGESGRYLCSPPRDGSHIRNFLVCVFLPQVKWIAPIRLVRGLLHYMKETVTLNVTAH